MRTRSNRKLTRRSTVGLTRPAALLKVLVSLIAASVLLGVVSHPAFSKYEPGMPPNIDPGTAAFSGPANPVPAEPVAFDPSKPMLEEIYDADLASGGTSFWFDRVLERSFLSSSDSHLYTRGRALYMYSHAPATLGFAGGYAYRERPTGSNQNLYTIAVSGGGEGVEIGRVAGQFGNAVKLNGTSSNQYVTLPTGIVNGLTSFTIAAWVNPAAINTWARVFDFGTGQTANMFLTVSAGSAPRFAITTSGSGGEQRLNGTTALPTNQWTHIAVTLSGTAGTLYVNGTAVATNASMTLNPSSLGSTTNNWIGQSQYADPLLNATVDEFQIYNRALSATEVQSLTSSAGGTPGGGNVAWYRFDEESGATALDSSGSGRNATIVTASSSGVTETTSERRQYPSHWSSVHTATGVSVAQKKFITFNNVAVTNLTITNTGSSETTRTLTVSSPIAATPSPDGTELTGTVTARYEVTKVFPRLSGDGMTVSGTTLTRTLTLAPGEAVTVKVQLGAIANELPESAAEYERFRSDDPQTAFLAHVRAYNRWWVENVPYIDIPDQNVKKMSYYRTFLNRFNYVDANVPGNDYQFPVSIEGVLGYNNAIQLTQPMHLQDLKYFRNPLYSYGNWVSSGETSKCTAFTSNPGSFSWGNTYEQYIGREGWNSYKVHGGDLAILRNFAKYVECDVKGQLAKYDTNNNFLIAYASGALTGNDADAVALAYFNPPFLGVSPQDRTETAFWYSGAKAAAEAYSLLGNDAKAAELNALADNIKNAILTLLWDPLPPSPPEATSCWPVPGPPLCGGKVFKQKDVNTGILVPWKDQQNFSPFTEGVVPNTDDYKLALRFYADRAEFPIMPFYTANQRDKQEAQAAGRGGSNNFSNINSTLQAQLYSRAIREYPSEYITPDMYRKLLEWLSWVQYVNGDNRFPDNNEFFFSWNPTTRTLGRSGIHHNILGAFNFMIIDDIAGVRPRLDDSVELWPIDVGYDHFMVNNLSYHGRDLTVVWDLPGDGKTYYGSAPEGYSVYVDGQRAFTVDDLAHVTWNSKTGAVSGGANVLFSRALPLQQATEVSLTDNERVVDMFQKAGLDLSEETGWAVNLAEGKPVSASFTTTSPSVRATAPENAVDGFTFSGLPIQIGSYLARNTIWGTQGSPNVQDWLEVDLEAPRQFNVVKLYFFSDKAYGTQSNGSGNTYREPTSYTVQYFDGTTWVDVPDQVRTPSAPLPNYNKVEFEPISAQRVRVLLTRTGTFGIGLKEIQVFDTTVADRTAPVVTIVAPEDEAAYGLNETVLAEYSCEDEAGGSGLASCTGDVAAGEPIDTSTVGTHTFSVTGTDEAGNSATITHAYSVEYTFTGFHSPVENPPTVNRASAGRTIPLKWHLSDSEGVPVTDPASFVSVTSQSRSCDLSAPSIDLPESEESVGGLQNIGEGEWQFNWKTSDTWKGQCRIVSVNLADGTSHKAFFQFRT